MIVIRTGVPAVAPATGAATATAPVAGALRSPPPAWSWLPDIDGSIAVELDVRAWPTLLIVTKFGVEVARLFGSSESIPLKLPIYVDLADGITNAARAARAAAEYRAATINSRR